MELIDKAAVVAEIERRKHKLLDNIMFERDKEWVVRTAHQLNRIILFLDTLEVKEVDLEEEINRFGDSCAKHKNERGGNVIWSNKLEVEVLARHFFELGLKAQK